MSDERSDHLIGPDGQPRYGIFQTTPTVINVGDFNYRTPTHGRQLPGRKWLDYKQFQYIGVISDNLLLGCALGDFRYIGLAFVYTYEPATGTLTEFSTKLPLGRGISLTNRPLDGTGEFNSGGNRIRITADIHPRVVTLDVHLKSGLTANVSFDLDDDPVFQPMSVCTQIARHGWVFTQKIAGVACRGTVTGPFGQIDLAEVGAYAHYDYSVGYMRRETFWNWACFAGNADGQAIGLNLSCGVNETSYSENCFWVDGVLHPVGLATFDYDRRDPSSRAWHVSTADGAIALDFVPEGIHVEKVNAFLIVSDFKQLFGRFSGTIRTHDGTTIEITDQYGFVEDQYSKW